MPTLAVTDFNIVCAVLGGFVTLFGLFSYLLKEKFCLSEACKFWGFFFLYGFTGASHFLQKKVMKNDNRSFIYLPCFFFSSMITKQPSILTKTPLFSSPL